MDVTKVKDGEHKDLKYMVLLLDQREALKDMPTLLSLQAQWHCGYVQIPEGHPWHGLHYDEITDELSSDVHGGLTYSDAECHGHDGYWIGFDAAHGGDDIKVQDVDYMVGECKRLCEMAASKAESYTRDEIDDGYDKQSNSVR